MAMMDTNQTQEITLRNKANPTLMKMAQNQKAATTANHYYTDEMNVLYYNGLT